MTRKPAHKPAVYEVWERRSLSELTCEFSRSVTDDDVVREAGHQFIESCQWADEAMLLVNGKALAQSVGCTLTEEECR